MFPFERLETRVLAYNYKSEVLTSPSDSSVDRIRPFATSLVAELCADRQLAGASKRPIIFICHGVGGLVVKRALSYSSTRRAQAVQHQRSIFVSTYAILFLGTPHDGIQKDSLLARHKKRRGESSGPSQFVLSLIKGSEMLEEITDQFVPIMNRFAIYNFWEQEMTRLGKIDAYIVEEESAAPPWDDTEKCGIYTTHESMVKFATKRDHGYRILLEALTRYISQAPSLIEYRWGRDLEALQQERQREAEDLLRPRHQHVLSNDTPRIERNEWYLIPRCSSTYFTGRQTHADFVRENLGSVSHRDAANRHQVVVIYGLGGAGKTQFCLRYAEENKSR